MQVYKNLLLISFTLLLSKTFAANTPDDCAEIIDNADRLSCFDSFYNGQTQASTPEKTSVVEARRQEEAAQENRRFSLVPHKLNYILPLTYNNSADYSPYPTFGEFFNDAEVKAQISIKTPLARNLWKGSSLWAAYTQQSYWQLYADEEASAPFRETNHQPELMWSIPQNWDLAGWSAEMATFAINHQSNGQVEPLSRSWNRLTGELAMSRGRFVASAKTWYRLKEDEENDNNPNIEDFMGRVELGLAYKGNKHTFGLGLINNLDSDNRSGVEFNWIYPLTNQVRLFTQIYSGYGENMINMEDYGNRIGFGFTLNDWL